MEQGRPISLVKNLREI